MKRLILSALILALGGIAYAGNSVYQLSTDTATVMNNLYPPTLTTSTIASTPGVQAGGIAVCTNCVRSYVCVSTGAANGAWVVAADTGTLSSATHCQ